LPWAYLHQIENHCTFIIVHFGFREQGQQTEIGSFNRNNPICNSQEIEIEARMAEVQMCGKKKK